MSRRSDRDVPGRDTRPAYNSTRRTWYGHGTLTLAEKSGLNRFLHDATYVFADISIFSLPALLYVMLADSSSAGVLTAATLTAWLGMVFVATTIRGGWLKPLATDTLGWLSFRPVLVGVGLRVVTYPAILGLAGVIAVEFGTALEQPLLAVVIAPLLTVGPILVLPRIGETLSRRVTGRQS